MFQLLLLFAFVIPAILFLFTQQRTLQAIQPANRLLNPGIVWLQLIPVFGQVWQFFIVIRIASSIRKEIVSRQDDSILGIYNAAMVNKLDNRPTLRIGIAYCILFTTGIFANIFTLKIEVLYGVVVFLFFSGMICWIIYWVLLAQYKNKLNRMQI
jgi:hypothetical protein